jgi:APA family basic amino acid/polyamine antiporter
VRVVSGGFRFAKKKMMRSSPPVETATTTSTHRASETWKEVRAAVHTFFTSSEVRRAVASRGASTSTARLDEANVARGESESSGLKKVLTRMDLTMLGIGGIIGAGVFVLTGAVAHDHAGPAVVFSYIIAASTSAVTGLAYAEFAVAMPVAGSAYNYMFATFGEYAAFLTGCNLALELTIASAAIARGWTSYFMSMFGVRANAARLTIWPDVMELDLIAGLVVAGMTALLVSGAKETAKFNSIVTYVSLVVIAIVIFAGAAEVHHENWSPFAPNGMKGIISGASVVIFAFVGFDTIATCAEEVANPSADLPFGILGSLGVCAALYALMCLVITGMVSYVDIDVHAPFAMAFATYGLGWVATIVSIGAVAAITTSLLLSMMGQPRIFMVMARDGLLPAWFSDVSEKYGTPANASLFSGIVTGGLAVLLDINLLAQLVSIGTLSIFCCVNLGLIVSRCTPKRAEWSQRAPPLKRAAALFFTSLAFGVDYRSRARISWFGILTLIGVAASTLSFLTIPMTSAPSTFRMPLVPFLPAFGVLLTCILIAGLGALAWIRYVVYTLACTAGYLTFAVARHHRSESDSSSDAERRLRYVSLSPNDNGNDDTELPPVLPSLAPHRFEMDHHRLVPTDHVASDAPQL